MRPAVIVPLSLFAVLAVAYGLWPSPRAVQLARAGAADAGQGEGAAAVTLPQGHMLAAIVEEPDNVNPFTANSQIAERFILAFTHDGLLDIDPATGTLRPALAESWQLDADSMGVVFTLRAGVVFADGAALQMSDVLFGWELASAGHLSMGFVGDAMGRIASADALDERRLHVRWKERHFSVLEVVGKNWLVAQRSFFVDRVAAQARRLGQEVPGVATAGFAVLLAQIERECGPGTGPYQLRNPPEGGGTWQPRSQLELRRNDRSWRRKARPGTWNLQGVRLLFRDKAGVPAALAAREIDWLMVRDPEVYLREHPDLAPDYRVLAYDHPSLGAYRVAWNCGRGPCQDVRVRQALAKLFDRAALARSFSQHGGVAEAYAKPGSLEYPTTPGPTFDPSAARAELRLAGFDVSAGKPLRLSLLAPAGSAEIDAVVAGFQDVARGVGIDLSVRSLDFPAFVAERGAGTWDGEVASQGLRAWADPFELVHSGGADNCGGYGNAEVDRLAAAARLELDGARRADLWRQMHTIVQREQPFTFLLHQRVQMLFNRHIQGAEIGRMGLVSELLWVPQDKQRR